MYTRNYDEIRKMPYTYVASPNSQGRHPNLINTSGNFRVLGPTTIAASTQISYPERNFSIFSNTWVSNFCNSMTGYTLTIDIGTGNKELDYNDYSLNNILGQNDVSKSYVNVDEMLPELDENEVPTGYYLQTIKMDFKNIKTDQSDILIKEYGLFIHNSMGTFLLSRDLFNTPKVLPYGQYCQLDFTYKYGESSLVNTNDYIPYTWDQIIADSNNGNIEKYTQYLGKKKTLIYVDNGHKKYAEVILMGKEKYDLADGSGKAKLLFMMNQPCLKSTMATTGWENSPSRTILNTTFFDNLPVNLKSAIKLVKVKCDRSSSQKLTVPIEVEDRIFLPCIEELGIHPEDVDNSFKNTYCLWGQGEYCLDSEGKDIFNSNLKRQKYYDSSQYFEPETWRVRNGFNGTTYQSRHYFIVNSFGVIEYSNSNGGATTSIACTPMFCI